METASTEQAHLSTFIKHVTLDHLSALARPDVSDLSGRPPALKAKAEARADGYDTVCIPLTTEKWRERWRQMCLLPDETKEGGTDKAELEKQAEQWRAQPVFTKDEVTITRVGECSSRVSVSPV